MKGQMFKSGDTAPVSGNYQFTKHQEEVKDCIPRPRVYLHLRKGMKIPLHDECSQPAIYRLMTVTNEDAEPKIVSGV